MSRHPEPPPGATCVEVRIPFQHVDLLRVAWHGRYLEYLEVANAAFLRERRLDLADMIELGYAFVVAETNVRHLHPLRYGDLVRVSCWTTGDEGRIDLAFDLSLGDGTRCATARVSLVTLGPGGELCLATPAVILERLRAAPSTREAPP